MSKKVYSGNGRIVGISEIDRSVTKVMVKMELSVNYIDEAKLKLGPCAITITK